MLQEEKELICWLAQHPDVLGGVSAKNMNREEFLAKVVKPMAGLSMGKLSVSDDMLKKGEELLKSASFNK